MSEQLPVNTKAEPLHVLHAQLKRSDEESRYRSHCPVCTEGVLFLRRDQKTLVLLAEDNCIACGQRIIYDDIEELRKKDHA
jgi:uncharacterized protein (DUF983 family)